MELALQSHQRIPGIRSQPLCGTHIKYSITPDELSDVRLGAHHLYDFECKRLTATHAEVVQISNSIGINTAY